MQARLKFSKNELKKLPGLQKEARLSGDFVLFRRTCAILMVDLSVTHQETADALGVCREVIGRWVALFMAKGARGLRPKKAPGRKSKLSKAQKKELVEQIQKGPKHWGYPGGVWTSAMIQEHILKQFGALYSIKYIPQLLRDMGLSHIKPKYTFSLTEDQLKAQIKWIRKTLPDLYEQVKAVGGVLLFQDETTCLLQPHVMATWALKGNPPTEEKNPKRGQLKVLGTIELFTGQFLYSLFDAKKLDNGNYEKLDNGRFAQFLRQVENHYKGREVFIILDSATYHGGPKLRKFLAEHSNIHLHKQPVKSPNLNPIEKVWKELKKDRTHNVYFRDKAALKSALRKGLFALQQDSERIRRLMKKWEKVVSNPIQAMEGHFDSSLVPKKHQDSILKISMDVAEEIKKDTLSQEVAM